MTLEDEVWTFLEAAFPGSTLSDGYFFVRINSAVRRSVQAGKSQAVADRLGGPLWMVSVGLDPVAIREPLRIEATSVIYNPDWNISEQVTMHFVELAAAPSIDGLSRRFSGPGALAILSPARRIALNVALLSLHGPEGADFSEFEPWLASG